MKKLNSYQNDIIIPNHLNKIKDESKIICMHDMISQGGKINCEYH